MYNLLQAISYEYKAHLPWLLPFPGDRHNNYQKAFMKPYAAQMMSNEANPHTHSEVITLRYTASSFCFLICYFRKITNQVINNRSSKILYTYKK